MELQEEVMCRGGCFRQGSGTALRWGRGWGGWVDGGERCKLCSGGAGQVNRASISVHMH